MVKIWNEEPSMLAFTVRNVGHQYTYLFLTSGYLIGRCTVRGRAVSLISVRLGQLTGSICYYPVYLQANYP